MKRKLGDIFGALFVIGITLIIIGMVFSYFPVREKHLIGYADNDYNGIPETPVYGEKYVYAFAPLGAYIFIPGFILSLSGAIVIIKTEKGTGSPEGPYSMGLKYTERMPPPIWDLKS